MQKVWFITGCSRGFGKLLAEELLKQPVKLVATARNITSLDYLKNFPDKHPDAELLIAQLDVTNSTEIEQAVTESINHFGRIDVLVNNAGYGLVGALEESNIENIRKIFDTNVFGLIEVTQKILPIMRKQRAGHIINMSSVRGISTGIGGSIYSATKFSVEGLSETLASEVKPLGIKVSIIEPGPFRTDFLAPNSISIEPNIEDYDKITEPIRNYIKTNNGNQAGDPIKAIKIIIELTNMENPPLRIPLGNAAIDSIYNKIKELEQNMNQVEPIARSADF